MKRAMEYDMPLDNSGCKDATIDAIKRFAIAQFEYWTKDGFASQFRKMLTIEKYRDEKMAELYKNYLSSGSMCYMESIFKDKKAAIEFYAPVYMMYTVFDKSEDKDTVYTLLKEHVEKF